MRYAMGAHLVDAAVVARAEGPVVFLVGGGATRLFSVVRGLL